MSFRFDHVAQQVPNIADAIAFYQKLLPKVEIHHQDDSWGLIEANGVKIAFVLAAQHPNHVAWRVSSADLETLARQHQAEIKPHRDGTRSFYVDAPGGNTVEIIHYPEDA